METQEIELDNAKPSDLEAIEKFYENHLSSIVGEGSPTSSQRTCSSPSISIQQLQRYDSESTVASNSDEELEHESIPSKEQFLQYQLNSANSNESNLSTHDGNIIVVNHGDTGLPQTSGPRIETVAIQNSSDIQFGNKTFYNGPVTIKQFLLDEKNSRWINRSNGDVVQIESGTVNKGFDGKHARISVIVDCSQRRKAL